MYYKIYHLMILKSQTLSWDNMAINIEKLYDNCLYNLLFLFEGYVLKYQNIWKSVKNSGGCLNDEMFMFALKYYN